MQSSSLATTSPARGLLLDVISVRIIEIPNSTNHTLFNFQRSTEVAEACKELPQDDPAPKTTIATVLSGLCSLSLAWNVRAGVPRSGSGNLWEHTAQGKEFFCPFCSFLEQAAPRVKRVSDTKRSFLNAIPPPLGRNGASQPGSADCLPGTASRDHPASLDRPTPRPAALNGALRSYWTPYPPQRAFRPA